MSGEEIDVDDLVGSIAASPKYRVLDEATIERVARQVAATGSARLDKRVRRELHHVLAAYHLSRFSLPTVDRLVAAIGRGASDEAVRAGCSEVLSWHATTRERYPLLSEGYYERLFAVTGAPRTVADLAAAVHPFEWRWTQLPAESSYVAYDINRTFVVAADRYLRAEGAGRAEQRDLLVEPPIESVDLALFLMTYHCLEQQLPGAGWRVIERSPGRWSAVSLPVASLGNRQRARFGILAGELEARLTESGRRYLVQEWETERLYLIEQPAPTGAGG
ncbi:MAG: hypothetical protein OEV40_16745 [Acidimicrobiia bacterium]|nr:hypothetical protein [Acidimicrobiia bacterium]